MPITLLSRLLTLALFWVLPNVAITVLGLSVGSTTDLGHFMRSGRQSAAGLNPYNPELGQNLNAPPGLLPFHFLALAAPDLPPSLWVMLSGALYVACVAILVRMARPRNTFAAVAFCLAQSPIWFTLILGQLYVFLLVPVVAAFWALRCQRPLLGAALVGILIAVKPNFALWSVLFLVAGYRREALVSGISAALCSVPALLLYGPNIYVQWLAGAQGEMPLSLANKSNVTLFGLSSRAGFMDLGLLLSAALVAIVVIWALRQRPDRHRLSHAALATAVMASPVGWLGYALFLLPVFLGPSNRWLFAAKVLLLIPYWLELVLPLPMRYLLGTVIAFVFPLVLLGMMVSREDMMSAVSRRVAAPSPSEHVLESCLNSSELQGVSRLVQTGEMASPDHYRGERWRWAGRCEGVDQC